MAELETGQYEVILRKKYEFEKGVKGTPIVPYYNRFANSKQGKNEAYWTLNLYMEIRKDIPKYQERELDGKRFVGVFPFIKVTELVPEGENDAPTIRQDAPAKRLLKSLYAAVDATSDFTRLDLAEHMIDKPILVTINVEPDKDGYGVKNIIKKIEPTKEPEIQPSALIDELDNHGTDSLNDIGIDFYDF